MIYAKVTGSNVPELARMLAYDDCRIAGGSKFMQKLAVKPKNEEITLIITQEKSKPTWNPDRWQAAGWTIEETTEKTK